MTGEQHQTTMHIGELAERSGMSLHTIRHYDEINLLKPSGRSDGGFRLYVEDDLRRLMVIRRMKPLGFSLDQMRAVLEIVDALPAQGREENELLMKRIDQFIDMASERRSQLATQLAMADEFLGLLQQTADAHRH